jgi:hypothetical protein
MRMVKYSWNLQWKQGTLKDWLYSTVVKEMDVAHDQGIMQSDLRLRCVEERGRRVHRAGSIASRAHLNLEQPDTVCRKYGKHSPFGTSDVLVSKLFQIAFNTANIFPGSSGVDCLGISVSLRQPTPTKQTKEARGAPGNAGGSQRDS